MGMAAAHTDQTPGALTQTSAARHARDIRREIGPFDPATISAIRETTARRVEIIAASIPAGGGFQQRAIRAAFLRVEPEDGVGPMTEWAFWLPNDPRSARPEGERGIDHPQDRVALRDQPDAMAILVEEEPTIEG
jgi:hypothetical protein